jgi:hypothetical protein
VVELCAILGQLGALPAVPIIALIVRGALARGRRRRAGRLVGTAGISGVLTCRYPRVDGAPVDDNLQHEWAFAAAGPCANADRD